MPLTGAISNVEQACPLEGLNKTMLHLDFLKTRPWTFLFFAGLSLVKEKKGTACPWTKPWSGIFLVFPKIQSSLCLYLRVTNPRQSPRPLVPAEGPEDDVTERGRCLPFGLFQD